jgi:hypothetical protein
MKRIVTIALVLGLLAPGVAEAHTLSIGTAIARLNRSITHEYVVNPDTPYVDRRYFDCRRANAHRVNCSFGLQLSDGSFTCGRGYAWISGIRYGVNWYTRQYLCGGE